MRLEGQEKIEYTKMAMQQLTSLVINQDTVTQGWVKYLVTVEAALIVALFSVGTIFTNSNTSLIKCLLKLSLFLLPIFGIAVAVALSWIIVRERKWQAWYALRASELPKIVFPIMPEADKARQIIGEMSVGRISWVIICLAAVIVLFWIIILLSLSTLTNPVELLKCN